MKRKISIFLYKIYLYFKQDFTYDVKNFLEKFNLVNKFTFLYNRYLNLKYFFPTIWNDYWFDSYYLYILIRAKLIQMESKFRNSGMTLESGSCADEMKEVIEDLNRLINSDIETEEYDLYYKYYPKSALSFNTKFKKFIKLVNRKDSKNEEELTYFKEMIIRIDKREEELRFKIFNSIAKNSAKWWD